MTFKIFERVKGTKRFQQYDFKHYRTRQDAMMALRTDKFSQAAQRRFGLKFKIQSVSTKKKGTMSRIGVYDVPKLFGGR